jgi:hypothetical protein
MRPIIKPAIESRCSVSWYRQWVGAVVVGFTLLTIGFSSERPAQSAQAQHVVVDPRFGVVEAWRAPGQATALGVGWERLTLWWKALQPTGPNSFNFFATERDHFITKELAAGRHLVGELINTPDWAAVDVSEHGTSIPKGLYLPYNDPDNYWGHFVSLMAKRYAGRIDDWVVWNEVNIPSGKYATWKGTVADYAQLVKVAYLAARSVNPKARIILFGDPYWFDHGAFFNRLLDDLIKDPNYVANNAYFDAANVHLYSRPTDFTRIITLYRKMLAKHGLNKPIWIGETNAIPYNDPARKYPPSNYFATLSDQASFMPEAFALALALGVQRIEVNRMVDGVDFTHGGIPLGLMRNDKTVRPAYWAYLTVTRLFAGVTGGSIAIDARTGVYTVTLIKPEATITVAWDQRPVGHSVSIPAISSSALLYDKLGTSKAVSAKSGKYVFILSPSTGNTDPHNRKDYVMGGSPVILVQTL